MNIFISILRLAGLMCLLTCATYWALRLYDTLSPDALMCAIGAGGLVALLVAAALVYFWGDPD
jgi:hypothetical protein